MNAAPPIRLTVNVVELNPYAPRPYVFTEAALCLRDSIRSAGFASDQRVNEADPRALSIVLGAVRGVGFFAGSDWSSSGILFARYDRIVAACTALMRSPTSSWSGLIARSSSPRRSTLRLAVVPLSAVRRSS